MTFAEWSKQNIDFQDWYQSEYPFLITFDFPVPEQTLLDFYYSDIDYRNLEPEEVYIDNYDLLFSYFLYWYPQKSGGWKAKTWTQNTIKNLPGAIQKTLGDISKLAGGTIKSFFDSIGISPMLIFLVAAVILGIYLFKK